MYSNRSSKSIELFIHMEITSFTAFIRYIDFKYNHISQNIIDKVMKIFEMYKSVMNLFNDKY